MRLRASAGGVVIALAIACAIPTVVLAGDGTFPDSGSRTVASVVDPFDLAIGDFNNDGRQDIVATDDEDGDYRVALGAGDGTFTPLPLVDDATANTENNSLLVADVTGDGNEDLAIGGVDQEQFSVYRGIGDGTFARLGAPYPTSPNGGGSTALAFAHLDGSADRAGDIVSVVDGGAGNDLLRIFRGTTTADVPNGGFAAPTDIALADAGPRAIAVGDFNGDGNDDIATANAGLDNVQIRRGNGAGSLGAPTNHEVGDDPSDLAVGDFNGDSAEDIVTASGDRISVLLGRGNGTFEINADLASTTASSVAVGDFNSDAAEDIAAAGSSTTDGFSTFIGNGNGSFAAAVNQAVPSTDPLATVVADFNRDGNQDLALANNQTDNLTIRDGGGAAADAGNLLINGGGEAPPGSSAPRTTGGTAPIPGWTTTGTFTNYRYGIGGAAYPPRLLSPRIGGQEAFFSNGYTTTQSTASQSVDVSGSAPSIDGGVATVRLTGYLGGYREADDTMQVRASFADAAGSALGTPVQIGPVTVADRKKLTTMLPRAASGAVPAGTRSITVTILGTHGPAVDIGGIDYVDSGYADRLGLFLTAPEPPPVPPGGGGDTTPPETTITKEPRAKSPKAKAKYKFTSSEPNSTFACKLDRKPFKPCDAGKAKYKKLDFGKHKFTVVATDPAGNSDPTPAKDKFKRK